MELYETGNASIWSDPYVREQLLKAHLNPNSDAASRKPQTIKASIDWILQGQPDTGSIIDLGCGPGLYTQEFAARGWQVVGVDINESAIDYATKIGKSKGLAVRYLHQSYLDKVDTGTFDIATCIYCDFGALTDVQQKKFLGNVHELLTPNGILVFDVFGKGISRTKKEGRSWERESANGFWSESPCYVLSECQHFEKEQVWGQKYIVIPDSDEPSTYVLWDHYFTVEKLKALLLEAGFSMVEARTDIVQESDFTSGDVLFVLARKSNNSFKPMPLRGAA
jgi:SAM-dependent methyltransferase